MIRTRIKRRWLIIIRIKLVLVLMMSILCLIRIFVYDTNSGQRIAEFKEHTAGDGGNRITFLATSPTEAAFMCASSNDNKNRFYATNKQIPQYANEEHSNSASQSVE